MIKPQTSLAAEIHEELLALHRVGSGAVVKAQEESRELGVPNVYSHRGRIYYELPSGELSLVDPLAQRESGT